MYKLALVLLHVKIYIHTGSLNINLYFVKGCRHERKNKILIIPRFVFYTIYSLVNLVKIFVKNFPLTTFRYKNMNMNNIIELKHSVFDKQKNKYKINFDVEKTLQYIKNL